MESSEFETDTAFVKVRLITQAIRHRELIRIGNERRYAGSGARGAVVGEIRDEPVARQQVQFKCGKAAPRVEGLFVQNDAAAEQRIGIRRQIVEIGDVTVV